MRSGCSLDEVGGANGDVGGANRYLEGDGDRLELLSELLDNGKEAVCWRTEEGFSRSCR